MKIKITLLLLTIALQATAQLYKAHDWEETQVFHELNDDEKDLNSVAIKEKYLIQYYAKFVGNSINLYETKHSIIRVNTDKGINKHNRVYIPMHNVQKVIEIKARVTQSDGSVKYLDEDSIKELQNVENYGNFKIFALEGVTKNSQLEFIYTLQRHTTSLGSVIVQKDYLVKDAEVIIRKPRTLQYRIKKYNGFPNMITKEVEGNKEALTVTITNIEAMTDEMSASPEANRMKVSYQVANSFASDEQMWDNVEKNIRTSYLSLKPKKYQTLINDYKKFTATESRKNLSEIINNICEYVTATYNISRTRNEELNELKNIIKNKQATESGIMKVYTCLFNFENIDYEFVLTSNRFNHKFDSNFFSNSNLQTALLYFIEEKKYIEPDNVNARLDFAPYNAISNKGLFIDKISRRFKTIDIPKSEDNIVQRDFQINVNIDEQNATVSCEQKNTGYRAKSTRGAYKYLKNKDINKFKSFTAVSGIDDAEFETFEIKDEDLSFAGLNIPVKLNYKYKSESLLETINDDYILNFGKVIGIQNELYQESERVNPIELSDLITYKYTFKIEIPDGYEAKGLEGIKINNDVQIYNKSACHFVSDYVVEDNTVLINVTESYNKLYMDLEYYEKYKNVVNTAFDFSKKSILFKKI